MSYITFTNTFTNTAIANLGTKIQQNFDEALSVVNGNIADSNFDPLANLSLASFQADSIVAPLIINPSTSYNVDLSFGLSTPKGLNIINSDSLSLLRIDDSGNVTIPLGMTNLYPIGTVIYFSGTWTDNSTIPGWYKCNGANGTPNLMNLFIRGSGTPGVTGGYSDVILGAHSHSTTVGNNSATHTHTFTGTLASISIPNHTHTYSEWQGSSGSVVPYARANNIVGSLQVATSAAVGSDHTHTIAFTSTVDTDVHIHTVVTNSAGDTLGIGLNIPAYYSLIPVTRIA